MTHFRIIPFVAADAVLNEELKPKIETTYSQIDREDKFPVYYPKEVPFANRREDVYNPTNYPIFTDNLKSTKFPSLAHSIELSKRPYTNVIHRDLATSLHAFTVAANENDELSNRNENNEVTKIPIPNTKSNLEKSSVNLFSPPIETEGILCL